MPRNLAAFGLYPSLSALHLGVEALTSAGFRQTDISVVCSDTASTTISTYESHTKAPEGAMAGAMAGGMAGGILAYLAGIGAISFPGTGPLLVAGPIVATLVGVGAAGTAGGFIGALAGLGIPEYEAQRYEGRLRDGGVLLSVHCDDGEWASRGTSILKETGADEVATGAEKEADYQP